MADHLDGASLEKHSRTFPRLTCAADVTHNASLSEPPRKASHIMKLLSKRESSEGIHECSQNASFKLSKEFRVRDSRSVDKDHNDVRHHRSGGLFLDMEPSRRPGRGKNLAL